MPHHLDHGNPRVDSFRKVSSFGEIRTYLTCSTYTTNNRTYSIAFARQTFLHCLWCGGKIPIWIRSLICSITASHSHSINHSNRRTMKTTTMTKEKMIFNSFSFKQQPGENESSVFFSLQSYEFNAYSYRVVLMWLFLQLFWEDVEIRSWIDWIVID